jgi:hypothetical protein
MLHHSLRGSLNTTDLTDRKREDPGEAGARESFPERVVQKSVVNKGKGKISAEHWPNFDITKESIPGTGEQLLRTSPSRSLTSRCRLVVEKRVNPRDVTTKDPFEKIASLETVKKLGVY